MFLLISHITKNSCSCFSLPVSYMSEANPSMSILQLTHLLLIEEMHFFSFGFSFRELYTLA